MSQRRRQDIPAADEWNNGILHVQTGWEKIGRNSKVAYTARCMCLYFVLRQTDTRYHVWVLSWSRYNKIMHSRRSYRLGPRCDSATHVPARQTTMSSAILALIRCHWWSTRSARKVLDLMWIGKSRTKCRPNGSILGVRTCTLEHLQLILNDEWRSFQLRFTTD